MPMRWVARGALTLLTLLSPRDATIGTPSMALVSIGDSAGSVATSSTLLAAAAEAAVGIEYVWVGGRGYWSDASNWSPAGVPGINDTAVIKAFKGQDANMNAEYNTSIWLGAPPASPPILNGTMADVYANHTNYANTTSYFVCRLRIDGGSLVVRSPFSLSVGGLPSADDVLNDGIRRGHAAASGGSGLHHSARGCGSLTWSGGSIDGDGLVQVVAGDQSPPSSSAATAAFVLNGTAPKILSGGVTLVAANATVAWQSGDVLLGNYSSFEVTGPRAKLLPAAVCLGRGRPTNLHSRVHSSSEL